MCYQLFNYSTVWKAFVLFQFWLTINKTSAAATAKLLQLCPTPCDPIDGSPPGSPVPGILQARILEWVAISSSNAWKWKVKVKSPSRVRLLETPWTAAYQAPPSMGFFQARVHNHSSTCFCVNISLHLSEINAKSITAGSYSSCTFSFIRHCQTLFQRFYYLTFPPTYEWSLLPHPHSMLSLFFYFKQSDTCVVMSCSDFKLHFPISHLYILFGEIC